MGGESCAGHQKEGEAFAGVDSLVSGSRDAMDRSS